MAWRRNLQVSSVGTSAERLGVGADHDGGRAAGAKGAATEETRKGLRLRILPGTGCHRAGPPSKSGARAGGGRSDDFTQSNCGGTEAELATSATTCLHPQPPSRAYICVRNLKCFILLLLAKRQPPIARRPAWLACGAARTPALNLRMSKAAYTRGPAPTILHLGQPADKVHLQGYFRTGTRPPGGKDERCPFSHRSAPAGGACLHGAAVCGKITASDEGEPAFR